MRFTQVSNSRPAADYKISRLLIHLEAHSSLSFTDSYPDPPLAQNCQRILVKIQKSCYNIPSLTVNKHQSTGKPLNKGFLVLL